MSTDQHDSPAQRGYQYPPPAWTNQPPCSEGTHYFRPANDCKVYRVRIVRVGLFRYQTNWPKGPLWILDRFTAHNPADHPWPPVWFGPVLDPAAPVPVAPDPPRAPPPFTSLPHESLHEGLTGCAWIEPDGSLPEPPSCTT